MDIPNVCEHCRPTCMNPLYIRAIAPLWYILCCVGYATAPLTGTMHVDCQGSYKYEATQCTQAEGLKLRQDRTEQTTICSIKRLYIVDEVSWNKNKNCYQWNRTYVPQGRVEQSLYIYITFSGSAILAWWHPIKMIFTLVFYSFSPAISNSYSPRSWL